MPSYTGRCCWVLRRQKDAIRPESSHLVVADGRSPNFLSAIQAEILRLTLETLEDVRLSLQKYLASRFRWVLSGKSKIKESLEILRNQNEDLRTLRKERPKEPKKKRQNRLRTPSTPQTIHMRQHAQRLHDILWPVSFECHCINLSLHTSFKSSTAPADFRLLITTKEVPCETCMCVSIISSHQEQRGLASPAEERIHDETDQSLASPMSAMSISTSNARVIDNLCPSLIPPLNEPSIQKLYLGYLGGTPDDAIPSHLAYQHATPTSISRASLSQYLANETTENRLFPVRERLRLAATLATAVLQYGFFNGPWFQDYWRSRDIFFFPEHNRGLRKADSPYIATSYTESSFISAAKNDQLFSLAVVLTEVSMCNTLGKSDMQRLWRRVSIATLGWVQGT
ncbi:hypothetical protein K440DRAFT_611942 [Wilcoxina mikolae CBS 423.85]|nr:hypothetical protein K440DRAFT_611942 [Wilcoxina mikolae CBS 423.85]